MLEPTLTDTAPPSHPSDAGSRGAARLAILAIVVLLGVTFGLNQFGSSGTQKQAAQQINNPERDPIIMQAKLMLRLASVLPKDRPSNELAAKQLDRSARGSVDLFRTTLFRAELLDRDDALAALESLAQSPDIDACGLRPDLDLARRALKGEGDTLQPDERDGFIKRHGFAARVALSQGKPADSSERTALLTIGNWFVVFGGALLVLMLLAGVASITCLVVAIVSSRRAKRAFEPPAPGGSVYLETVPVFVASFLVLKIALSLVPSGGIAGLDATTIQLLGQWLLLPVVFWPMLRGVRFAQFGAQVGWHRGRGILREIGAGIFGYFAGLPLFLFGIVSTLVLAAAREQFLASRGKSPEPFESAITDLLLGAGPLQLALIYLLATLWAPIVEETVFRGSLYRHLRSRLGFVVSGVITAFLFGVMHDYPWWALGPVIALGMVFAMMREWRGSLVAPMTAHLMHNATALGVQIIGLRLLTA